MRVLQVISGCQTGADRGGLFAAEALGIATGGWMPKGFRALDGFRPDLAERFGLKECRSDDYAVRTGLNVEMADVTIRLARNFKSPGEKCTLRWIEGHRKPHLDVDMRVGHVPDPGATAALLTAKCAEHGLSEIVLNVAGNSEETARGIEQQVTDYLVAVLDGRR